MMAVKGNPLLKWLAAPFVILAVIVLFSLNRQQGASTVPQDEAPESLDSEQAAALGVDGDTANDTLRTVVAESRDLKKQISDALQVNKSLQQQNEQLQQRLSNIDSRVDQRIEAAGQESEQQGKSLLDALQKQVEQLSQRAQKLDSDSGADMPIGFGVSAGDGKQFGQSSPGKQGLVWIEPQDATALDASGKPLTSTTNQTASSFSYPSSFGAAVDQGQNVLQTSAQSVGGQLPATQTQKPVRKVYTVPQNSTLMGSVAMSALIGRVPVDGTVNDPYPFKVLIGPDNLAANGIEIPGIAGAVATGTASGDWTLSCVRGQLRSLTFVFEDGTVRTLPAPQEEANGSQGQASSGTQQTIQGGLGWISDPYGIPCIAGERRSNAKEYLTNQSLVTAAGAGVAALLGADSSSSTTFSSGSTSYGSTSGDSALGEILSGGVSDIRSWMNKLYGEAFAAVYVQPGARVAIHVDQQLAIDYELKGRKVDYTAGATHVSTLD